MNCAPVYVVSDVHLGVTPPERERAFHEWMESAASAASEIVINGDLFDFWFEYGSVIPRGHTRTLGLLARVVDAGTRVHLIGGNHDWWAGSYLTGEVGLIFHPGPVRLELAGHRCLVAHGDGLGPGDLGYRMLRSVLRSRPARWAFRWLHPDVGALVARRVSRTRVETGADAPHAAREAELERWARERLLADESLDVVLLGHTHRPRRVEIASGRYYLNSGDWLHHDSYVVLASGEAPRIVYRATGSPPEREVSDALRGPREPKR